MIIAGEASGDALAAALVRAIKARAPDAIFFGAGGEAMAAAGVEVVRDMSQYGVTGITEVLKNYFKFRKLFQELLVLAKQRKPDVIIGVDYGGFNLRFGNAIKRMVCAGGVEGGWNPKLVQFVSPQVWASRPGRAQQLEADYDLLLSIFPFEKEWYAKRTPRLRVEFVGHPMLDRLPGSRQRDPDHVVSAQAPQLLLLPGSRRGELKKHLPPMLSAVAILQQRCPGLRCRMVLPNQTMLELAEALGATMPLQAGRLEAALAEADAAIASTGTVTMECAFFSVPTVTLYKTSWLTYEIGKRLITVTSLTMPNLMAGETVYPEFIQSDATPEKLANAAWSLMFDATARAAISTKLERIIASLGSPGATARAADAILGLFS